MEVTTCKHLANFFHLSEFMSFPHLCQKVPANLSVSPMRTAPVRAAPTRRFSTSSQKSNARRPTPTDCTTSSGTMTRARCVCVLCPCCGAANPHAASLPPGSGCLSAGTDPEFYSRGRASLFRAHFFSASEFSPRASAPGQLPLESRLTTPVNPVLGNRIMALPH